MRTATDVSTAPLAALGLLGGFVLARETGVRALGGVALAGVGAYAARTWLVKAGGPATAGLLAVYVGAMGVSHPLAKKIGPWPAVLGVAAVSAGASWVVADRR